MLLVWLLPWFLTRSFRIRKQDVSGQHHKVELYSYRGSQLSWDDFDRNLQVLSDNLLTSRNISVPIETAHVQGLLHRGIWIVVLNVQRQVLLLRRAESLKTCPGEWSLVGEHSEEREQWHDTVERALLEELRIRPSKIVNLLPSNDSVLVRTVYKETGKREAQATALFAAFVDRATQEQIVPDHEVAEWQWRPVSELEAMPSFCNIEITDLAHFVAKRLRELDLAS